MIACIIILSAAYIGIGGISLWWLMKSEEEQNQFRYEEAKWLH